MTDPRLDRIPQFDPLSRGFAAVSTELGSRPFRSYTWSCAVYNDQGREGACVGFAWSHELSARPKVIPKDESFALTVYNRAKQIDEWAGEDYSGTSVLAGIKATMEILNSEGKAYYGEYRWAFGTEDVLRVLGYKGPVVLGINWYENMYEPDADNFIHASGDIAGGHAILANGVKIVKKAGVTFPYTLDDIDQDLSFVRLHNSWGTGYGLGGDAFISVRDLDKLIHEDGEACIPVLRRVA